MSYALCENESISRELEAIAGWIKEDDKELIPEERERFLKLSDKITECWHEFDDIVDSYWRRMAEKDEQEEEKRKEEEKKLFLIFRKKSLFKNL
jgi:hypothetical protein